jgi:hypothetical protein
MRCVTDAKDKNKDVDTALNLFHNYLGASVYLFMHFYFVS